jgi:hypothetical protein
MRVLARTGGSPASSTPRSGDRLNITSGVDQAFTGINQQRPDKVSDDFYANPRTLTTWFNRAAFVRPAPGASAT